MSRQMIAVFCASSPSGPKKEYYLELARRLGQRLAEAGYGCVNGGSKGMMNALSKGVHEAGGYVHCVNLAAYPPDHEFHSAVELHTLLSDRQMALIAKGAAFVALPGGIGTLFEIAEVLARMSLHEISHHKPLICVGEEWDLLQALFKRQVENGLTFSDPFEHITFVPDLDSAIALLNAHLKPGT